MNRVLKHCQGGKHVCGAAFNRGFTLVEVLIVIGVFSVISSVCYITLSQYLNISEKLEARVEKVQNLDRAFSLLERDIRYAVNRSARSESSENEDAMIFFNGNGIPGEIIRLTSIHPDYRTPGLGDIHRVAWYEDDGDLYRTSWTAVDLDSDTPSVTLKLLEELDEVRIEQYVWSDDYGLQIQIEGTLGAVFPHGLRLELGMQDGTVYERTFDLAGGGL